MASEHLSFSYAFNYHKIVTFVSIIGAEHYATVRFLTILIVVASKHDIADCYGSRMLVCFFKPSAIRNLTVQGQQCFELYLLSDCNPLFFSVSVAKQALLN